MGLLETAPQNLRIIRLNRESENYAVELDNQEIKKIHQTPILRYSNVLSVAFYKKVIICEDSSDYLFYQTVLGDMGYNVSDALFLQAGGKTQFPTLAEICTSLQIPTAIIADIDILRDKTMQDIIESLQGNWDNIKRKRDPLIKDINQSNRTKSNRQVISNLKKNINKLEDNGNLIRELKKSKKDINTALTNTSPWNILKEGGHTNIKRGDPTKWWQEIQKLSAEIGLWIVPVGEVEGFCKNTSGHGPNWVQNVLENEDLGKLTEARQFLKALWGDKPETLN